METGYKKFIWIICMLIPCFMRAEKIKIPSSPVTFIKNKGQWQQEILFQSTSTSTSIYFLKNGLSFAQSGEEVENEDGSEEYPYLVWNMKFINQDKDLKISGIDGKKSVISYFSGKDSSKWVIRPEEYSQLNYQSVFKNIDLHFYGNGSELKYDYIVHKGGNVNSIRAYYEGINGLSVNAANELEIKTSYNVQLQKKPIAWQLINGSRKYIEVNYVLLNDTTFGFKASSGYNKNYDLVIDPLFQMVWSSYTKATGASNNLNYCFSNAMDKQGNVYLTGMVDGTFPVTAGAYSGAGNIYPEIFVAKFSSDGTTMLYGTYLPGNSSEHGIGIAVDDSGRAYVTGVVDLNITGITNFPSTANAYQPVHNTGSDAFLTVLNSTGTGLVYSTFLGGSGGETGYDIDLGPPGIAYITGNTSSTDFPIVASSLFPTGGNNMFVTKFDINQSGAASLIYSTKIGAGSFNNVAGRSISVNSAGNAFITGTVYSSNGTHTFPTTAGAYATVYNSGQDNIMSYVTKLSASTPVSISYSTLLTPGTANAIEVDNTTGDVFITGTTFTFAFPVSAGALQPLHAGIGGTDAFVVKLNSTGTTLLYSTFLGGYYYDQGTGLAVNSAGEVYVAGITQDSFPTSPGALQQLNAGSYDFFVAHINAGGTAFGCGGSTYVGGNDADYTGSFYDYAAPQVSILDHGGNNDTISISATSHSTNFPTTPGVYGPVKVNGIADQPVFFKMTCATTSAVPVAAFTSNIIATCDTVTVNFTDHSANNPDSWQWSFPGAVPNNSTGQFPPGIVYTTSGIHYVTLVACNSVGCDTITDSILITIPAVISFNLGKDTTICDGNSILLSAPAGFSSYQWLLNGNNFSSADTISATLAGTYIVVATNSIGCIGTDTIVIDTSKVDLTLINDTSFCNGSNLFIDAGSGFSSYQWLLNGNIISTSDTITITQGGNYFLTVSSVNGCTASDNVNINIDPLPIISIAGITDICESQSTILIAGGAMSYTWSPATYLSYPDSAVTLSTPLSGITYMVTGTDSNNCSNTATVDITVSSNPLAFFSYALNFNCSGIELITENKSVNATHYTWNFGDGGTSSETNPVHYYASAQELVIQLIAFNGGCADTFIIDSVSFLPPDFSALPNIFTPNNDGINDCFIIPEIDNLENCFALEIFNRWGSKIYESENIHNCWDGKNMNGKDLPDGVYFYIISLRDEKLKGLIHLNR